MHGEESLRIHTVAALVSSAYRRRQQSTNCHPPRCRRSATPQESYRAISRLTFSWQKRPTPHPVVRSRADGPQQRAPHKNKSQESIHHSLTIHHPHHRRHPTSALRPKADAQTPLHHSTTPQSSILHLPSPPTESRHSARQMPCAIPALLHSQFLKPRLLHLSVHGKTHRQRPHPAQRARHHLRFKEQLPPHPRRHPPHQGKMRHPPRA